MKTLKSFGRISLVELDSPVLGGKYAIMDTLYGNTISDGLCLDAANKAFKLCTKHEIYILKEHAYSRMRSAAITGGNSKKYECIYLFLMEKLSKY